ncbi:DnaB Replicative DNA helicase [uncultured Caudovirales phage]|uniref:DNA 5'-3' helicase n=1 Tax=uncultured Caudovirales phage TaxID=2100421 RepID=A0A6J5LFH3_9CAUD|nr:DnaB Replicative DNA helicase [uncultured Caudovirales phage]
MENKFNLQAEQGIIGGLMLDAGKWDDICELVSEKDFYRADHQLIFRHIARMMERNKQLDVITLAESIESTGKLEKIGGLVYLGDIAHSTVSVSNIASYARIVHKLRRERDFLAAIQELTEISEQHGDLSEKIENATNILNSLSDDKRDSVVSWTEATSKALESVERRYSSGGAIHGLKTHLIDFDEKTGGLHPGDLIILAGRPSMGKTAFALNIAENVALDGNAALVFSLEMSDEQLAVRSIASLGKVNLNALRSAKIDDDDWSKITYAIGNINEKPLFIDPNPMMTASQMHIRARKIKRQHGLSLIVIDYLQLMTEGGAGDSRVNELSSITRKLKLMAKDLQVPVICLSQLSRKVEERADKRPMMSDLRDSGAIEQDADLIVMMYRDDYYNKDSPNKGIAEANIVKQRMGECGCVRLTFQGEYSRFSSFAGQYYQPEKPKKIKRGFDD